MKNILTSLLVISLFIFGSLALFNNVSAATCVNLTADMSVGSEDFHYTTKEVTNLQNFLVSKGLMSAEPNGYFGPSTLAGVKSFQAGNGIDSTGFVGIITRTKIKEQTCGATPPGAVSPVVVSPAPVADPTPILSFNNSICIKLNQNLIYGSEDTAGNNDVITLQNFLFSKGLLKAAPNGYFGPSTLEAVKIFQASNGINSTGMVDVPTREKISKQTCDSTSFVQTFTPQVSVLGPSISVNDFVNLLLSIGIISQDRIPAVNAFLLSVGGTPISTPNLPVVAVVVPAPVVVSSGGGGGGSSSSGGSSPTYTVTYNGNGNTGGSVPVDSGRYHYSNSVTVADNTGSLVKTNYIFMGWNTAANGSGTSYATSSTFSIGRSNVTLYAVWAPVYTITYNSNGSATGTVPTNSNSYETGATTTVADNTGSLSKVGYDFVGWNTAANGSGTSYSTSSVITIGSSNVTLYAVWNFLFAGGDGSVGEPLQVSSWAELNNVRKFVSAHYILTANLSSTTPGYSYLYPDFDFLPIMDCGVDNNCTQTADNLPFSGSFNGDNKVITDLLIGVSPVLYYGLFGYSTGNISNLGLQNPNITGGSKFGALVGWMDGGTISNCYSAGRFRMDGSNMIGGLVGYQTNGTITNSYSNVDVTSMQAGGGLVGKQDGGIVSNSYSIGYMSGAMAGGLIGIGGSGTSTTNSFWNIGYSSSGGGTGTTTAALRDINTYLNAGWDIVATSTRINTRTQHPMYMDFPYLGSQIGDSSHVWYLYLLPCGSMSGTGVSGDECLVTSWTDLSAVRNDLTLYYKLTADLSSTTVGYDTVGNAWSPIGDCGGDNICWNIDIDDDNLFAGYFNGDSHVISDLIINSTSTNGVGLFGIVSGNISNIGLVNVDVTGYGSVGGLVGYQFSGIITDSYSTGSVDGGFTDVGGLVGLSLGTITNSFSSGNVTSSSGYVGGLVGNQMNGAINNSYSSGSVTSSGNYVGGLVGNASFAITNSYSTASATSSGVYVGGLIGLSEGTITNSYSTGYVSGSNFVAGLVGRQAFGSIVNSYWDKTTSSSTVMCGSAGGSGCTNANGTTTAGMKNITTFTNGGWDIVTNSTDLNNGYPFLGWQNSDSSHVWFVPNLPTYTVTYDGNGAATGTVPVDSNNYLTGATTTVADNTGSLSKAGFEFMGWNTAANGSGTSYATSSIITIDSANVTLYAVWTTLVCSHSPTDINCWSTTATSSTVWGPTNNLTGVSTSTILSNGKDNTAILYGISHTLYPPADFCYELTEGGVPQGTWYLPSIAEMSAGWQALGTNIFPTNQLSFWSSTEWSGFPEAYAMFFSSWNGGSQGNLHKQNSIFFRCLR